MSNVSFALLERRARRGEAYALGSVALHVYRSTRGAEGERDRRAVSLLAAAARAGCNRCSRLLAVGGELGWFDFDELQLAGIWRLHCRNERRVRIRVAAAASAGGCATISRLAREPNLAPE